MAIGSYTFGAGTGGSGASSLLVPYPATHPAGSLILLFAYCRSNTASAFSTPAGWSVWKPLTTTTYGVHVVYAKPATGSESGTETLTANASGNTQLAFMMCIPGAGTALSDYVAGAQENETATPYVNAGVTPTVDGALVLLFTGTQDCITNAETDGFRVWSGGTNLGTWTGASFGSTAGQDAGIGVGAALQTTKATTGNIQVTLQPSQSTYNGFSFSFAVLPQGQPTGELVASGAQVTCSGGPVTLQASGVPLSVSGATATASTGGTSISAERSATGATVACTTGGTYFSSPSTTEPVIGTVTYATATTWECVISNLSEETTFDVASSDGQSTSITVEVPAEAHTVRIEAGGTPVTATLEPGADASGATATGSTGSVSREASRPVTGAQATGATGSVSRTASVPVTGATASATTGGTVVLSSTQTHRIRIEAGGTPVEFDLVPGQDASGALATGTGAIALAAERPVTGAQATGATGSVRIVEHLMVSGAQATGATGSVALAGSRSVTGATATGRTGSVRIESNWGPPSPSIPWLPYNPGLGTLPRGWWKRRGRVW